MATKNFPFSWNVPVIKSAYSLFSEFILRQTMHTHMHVHLWFMWTVCERSPAVMSQAPTFHTDLSPSHLSNKHTVQFRPTPASTHTPASACSQKRSTYPHRNISFNISNHLAEQTKVKNKLNRASVCESFMQCWYHRYLQSMHNWN